MPTSESRLAGWFDEHRTFLWRLAYRITGSAPDADDVVQETFVRACQHAPSRLDNPRAWLMHVAVNLGRDVLRRRKRRGYVGPWLPTPIETEDAPPSHEPVVEGRTLEARYDLLESASLAFLQALEGLTPTQRAVLLLRDVFDYSAAEVGDALAMSAGNVRTIHHRARRLMAVYDRRRSVPTPSARARTEKALRQFLAFLGDGDVRAIEGMLAADVKAFSDGGGEFTAALSPIVGAARVALFFARLARSRPEPAAVTIRSVNGFPAALLSFASVRGRRSPRLLLSVELDADGSIAQLRVIASSAKLASIAAAYAQGADWRPPRISIAHTVRSRTVSEAQPFA